MRVDIKIDFLGEGADTAVLVRWLKEPGQRVDKDEPLCEVETYKTVFQVASPASGTLKEARGVSGDVIQLHDILGYIESHE